MKIEKHQLWIDGKWKSGAFSLQIRSPFSNEIVSAAEQVSAADLEEALQAAHLAFRKFSKTSRFLRARLLELMAQGMEGFRSQFIDVIVNEAGKPRSLAEMEVSRAVGTFMIASEEAKRYGGEVTPVDRDSNGRAFTPAISMLRPRGVVLGIAPFNFPLNLVAHKVAPALAIGAPILLKPSPQAPGAATLLARIFEEAAKKAADKTEAVPLSAFQVIHSSNEVIARAVEDPRIAILSFTGSDRVGWMLRDLAHKKKVELELGGNAAVIVHSDANLERAAARCAFGGYAYAGQVCISVQRIFVQSTVAEKFTSLLLGEIDRLPVGDPSKSETIVGPLIDSANADRVISWVEEAKKSGAQVLKEAKRLGNLISPILLTKVKADQKICCREVFGPVVVLEIYEKFEDAILKVNDSSFGLQAGIFTDSVKLAQSAIQDLEVGAVLINEIPTYRADHLPYGGVKDSGLGREGVCSAMREYSESKTVVQWRG